MHLSSSPASCLPTRSQRSFGPFGISIRAVDGTQAGEWDRPVCRMGRMWFGYGPVTSRHRIRGGAGSDRLGHRNRCTTQKSHSYRANSSVMNYSDPYHNAAYLPRTQAGTSWSSGFRIHSDHASSSGRASVCFGDSFILNSTTRDSHMSNLGSENVYRVGVIPYQVPIPGYHHNGQDSEDTESGIANFASRVRRIFVVFDHKISHPQKHTQVQRCHL